MILLDTSVLIEMFRVKDKQSTFFYRLSTDNNDFAISHNLTLATLNLKHFNRIPNLRILK